MKAWERFIDFMAVWPCQNDKKEIDGFFFEDDERTKKKKAKEAKGK